MSAFERVVAEVAADAANTRRGWDGAAFANFVSGAASAFWVRMGSTEPAALEALRVYLQLGAEALAQGYIGDDAECFVGELWTSLVPNTANSVPLERLSEKLVESWNLAEGLHAEALWLDRLMCNDRGSFSSLAELETTLESILERTYEAGPQPTWTDGNPEVVNLRPALDTFLPGSMHLLAPRTVCVHDRRHHGVCVGISLSRERGAALLGRIDCGEHYDDPHSVPTHAIDERGILSVGEAQVFLSGLGSAHASLAVGAGFVLAASENSQRLWVVSHG